MGFFDFMKRKKTEQEAPSDLTPPEASFTENITESQLFDEPEEETVRGPIPGPMAMMAAEEQAKQEEALREGASEAESAAEEGLPEAENEETEQPETDYPATSESEEAPEYTLTETAPEAVNVPESADEQPEYGEDAVKEALSAEGEEQHELQPEETADFGEKIEYATFEQINESEAVESEEIAAATETPAGENPVPEQEARRRFSFFGGRKSEADSAESAVYDSKRLHKDVKELKEERNAFSTRFERTYEEHSNKLNGTINALRNDIRQDVRGMSRDFAAQNSKANGELGEAMRQQSRDTAESMNAIRSQTAEESGKTRSEIQVGFARQKVVLQDVTETVSAMENRLNGTLDEVERKLDETAGSVATSLAGSNERTEQNKQEILRKIEDQGNVIIGKLSAESAEEADLAQMTPAEHYRNMIYSVCSLMLSIFSAFLLVVSCLQILKWLVMPGTGIHPIAILDFILVYLAAGGGIVLAMMQKRKFFGKGIREYLRSKNPAHSLCKLSYYIGMITLIVNTLLMTAALIAVLIVAFTRTV